MLNSVSFAKPVAAPAFKSLIVEKDQFKKSGITHFKTDFIWRDDKEVIELMSNKVGEEMMAKKMIGKVEFRHDPDNLARTGSIAKGKNDLAFPLEGWNYAFDLRVKNSDNNPFS